MTGLTDFQVAMMVLGLLVLILGLAVVGRARRPEQARPTTIEGVWAEVESLKARQERIDHQLVEQGHDLKQLRTMVNALPTERQVSAIALEVADMRGDIKVVAASAKALAASNQRIEDWIITKVDRGSSS